MVVASGLLLPGADINELVTHLKSCTEAKRVMLVGHEPQLGLLVASLLGRDGETISLKKGGCVTLKLDPASDDTAAFLWYLVPGKKRTSSFAKAFPQK